MNAVVSIPLNPVQSSRIHAIGHDPETNTLAVQFKRGDGAGPTYHYANIDAELFDRFRGAESLGTFFHKEIKANADAHPFTRVADAPQREEGS